MIAKVTSKIQITSYSDSSDKVVDLGFVESQTTSYTAGTGSGAANHAWHDTRTVSSGGNEDLDLAGGLSRGGYAYTFTKVKAIYVEASSSNTTNVQIKSAAANGFTGPFADPSDIINIPPGGVFLVTEPADGWAVTAGTGDLINIADSGAADITYTIVIVGVATIA